jgi:hypothetical protein
MPCSGLAPNRVHDVVLCRQGRSVMNFLKRKGYGLGARMNPSRGRGPTQGSAYVWAPNSQIDFPARFDQNLLYF